MHKGSDLAAISLDGRAEIRWLYTAGFFELKEASVGRDLPNSLDHAHSPSLLSLFGFEMAEVGEEAAVGKSSPAPHRLRNVGMGIVGYVAVYLHEPTGYLSIKELLTSDTMPNQNLEELGKPRGEYRQYLPDLNLKRFQVMRTQDAYEYAHDFKTLRQPPWLHALYMHWLDLLQEPFKGVTTDGRVGSSGFV